ncbi:MAG: FAD:protein FMN transferase, partial [Flavobacteriales bacterium]
SRHIANYLVEVGGEVRASGLSGKGKPWRVGIDKPLSDVDPKRPLQAVLNIGNASLATSGNYRKYYIKNGVKYAHTIDPATGYPVQHSLLSATVLAPDCMTADAWATAFMVMGIENARAVLARHSGLQAFLIYSGKNGDMESWCSDGLRALLEVNELSQGSVFPFRALLLWRCSANRAGTQLIP